MKCNGGLKVDFFHNETKIETVLTRVKNLAKSIIFGLDFLVSNETKVDYKTRCLEIQKHKITIPLHITTKVGDLESTDTSILFTTHGSQIDPFSAKFIDVKHDFSDPLACVSREALIQEREHNIIRSKIQIQPSVVSIEKGSTTILVQNFTPEPIVLYKDTAIAQAKQITKISSDKNDQQNSKIDNYILNVDEHYPANYENIDFDSRDLQNPFSIPLSVNIEQDAHISKDLNTQETQKVKDLLFEYQDIFTNSIDNIGCTNLFEHKIETSDTEPIKMYPRRQSPARKKIIDDIVQKLLAANIIKESHSRWSNPVVLISYPNGKHRLCIDYRKLNDKTKKTSYPLPRIDDIFDMLGGSLYFTTLDLKSGYYQVPLRKQDQEKTAFCTSSGLYEFVRMPFGVCNGPATFQRGMNQIFADAKDKSWEVLLDDIICFSKTFEEHLIHLRTLFDLMRKARLKCGLDKCFFFFPQLRYLGHEVSRKGLSPDPTKVEKLVNYPPLKTRKNVRQFLGLASYYRKFIKDFAKKSHYLTELTKEKTKFKWSKEAESEFLFLKNALSNEPVVLVHPNFDLPFRVQTDASDFAISAILSQNDSSGHDHPIQYLSRKLRENELKWNSRDKEAIAIVWALDMLRPYLIGKHFTLETDCNNLLWLMKAEKPQKLVRWAMQLQEYDFTIIHRSGKKNANADTLSRVLYDEPQNELIGNIIEIELPSSQELREMQNMDPDLNLIIRYISKQIPKNSQVKELLNTKGSYIISEDTGLLQHKISFHPPRVVLPPRMKVRIMKLFHENSISGHLGQKKTVHRIQERFFWNDMRSDVREFVRSCPKCQVRKPKSPKSHGKLELFPSKYPFDTVCIDILGPLPETKQFNKYVLVMIDRFTRWPELVALQDTLSITVADAFFDNIICRHSVPRRVLSDRGTNFLSKLFVRLNERLGTKKIFTSSYHPQTDGSAERIIQFISCSLAAYINEDQSDWDLFLPSISFAYRTSFIDGIRNSPFSLIYGRQPSLPTDILYGDQKHIKVDKDKYHISHTEKLQKSFEIANKAQEKYALAMKSQYDKKHKNVSFKKGDHVLLKIAVPQGSRCIKLDPRFEGPYEITEVHSQVSYTISHKITNETKRVHIQRLIPYNYSPLREDDKSQDSDTSSQNSFITSQSQDFDQNSVISEIIIDINIAKIIDSRYNKYQEQEYKVSQNRISKWFNKNDIPHELIKQYKNKLRRSRIRDRQSVL